MAYSFPPRGFVPLVNNQQFPPQFGTPPFPPPRQPFQASPPPPRDYSNGYDRPPFNGGAPHSGPRPPARFPHPNMPHARDARPSNRDVWAGVSASGPGPTPGQFPPRFGGTRPQRLMRPDPSFGLWSQHPANMSGGIAECESWPGLPAGRKGPHSRNIPGGGQHVNKNEGPKWNKTKRGKRGGSIQQKKRASNKKQNAGHAKGPYTDGATQQGSSQTEHYCDMCDRGFKSRPLFDDHIGQHVKCDHPGCKYEAHYKIIKLHKKLQHGPGSKKVVWLDLPSEVSEWRAERKRNYPSAENIGKKVEIMKNYKAKGVVLQNKYFGKMRQPKRKHGGPAEDLEIAAKKENIGSLAALSAYGEDSEEDEDGEIKEDASEPTAVEPPQKLRARFGGNKRGRQRDSKGPKGKKTRRGARAGRKVQEEREREHQERLKKRPNLLEMLLAPEIRRERNVILQCIRYIVRNDFFGVNQTKETESQVRKQESGRRTVVVTEEEPNSKEVWEKNGHSWDFVSGAEDKSTHREQEIMVGSITADQGPERDDGPPAEADSQATKQGSEGRPSPGIEDLNGEDAAMEVEVMNENYQELDIGAKDKQIAEEQTEESSSCGQGLERNNGSSAETECPATKQEMDRRPSLNKEDTISQEIGVEVVETNGNHLKLDVKAEDTSTQRTIEEKVKGVTSQCPARVETFLDKTD